MSAPRTNCTTAGSRGAERRQGGRCPIRELAALLTTDWRALQIAH